MRLAVQQDVTESLDPANADADAALPASRFTLRTLLRARGAWALADQAVVSLGNCVTGIVLAGTLPVHDFGVFILVFGMLLFLNSLHQSLVTYPLSVRGAESDNEGLRGLAGSSLLFTMAMALPLSLGVIIIVGIEHRVSLIPWAIAAMLLWQLQETMRRGIMAHLRHREAVFGDALSYLGQATIVGILASQDMLTLETAFMAIATTSLLGVLIQAWQLQPIVSFTRRVPELFREHWNLGRWVLLTSIITIITVQAMPWTLGLFHGNAEVAKFGVLAQVMGLSNPIIISVTGLIVPAVAASCSRQGLAAAKHLALVYGLQGALLLIPYYAAVLLLPELAIRVFSKNNPAYAGLGMHLRLFAVGCALAFPAQVMQALLNGLGRARSSFVAQCAFSSATLLLSLPLAAKFGLTGAVAAGVLPAIAYVAASATMLRKVTAETTSPGFQFIPLKSTGPAPEGAAA
jgi:O-antigen/teichoic acid export membrane protein